MTASGTKGVSIQSGICVLLPKRPLTPVMKKYPYPTTAISSAGSMLKNASRPMLAAEFLPNEVE